MTTVKFQQIDQPNHRDDWEQMSKLRYWYKCGYSLMCSLFPYVDYFFGHLYAVQEGIYLRLHNMWQFADSNA